MKVFISWSGELSRQLANEFSDWIPTVLQTVETYFTPKDIDKGSRWFPDISKELEKSDYGILCVTKENLKSPWMIFEAGALSKQIEESRVCPILFDIRTSDLPPVLAQFQAVTKFEKEEMKSLMKTLNKLNEKTKLEPKPFEMTFETFWPKLEPKVEEILQDYEYEDKTSENKRSFEDMIEEILDLTRSIARELIKEEEVMEPPGDEEELPF